MTIERARLSKGAEVLAELVAGEQQKQQPWDCDVLIVGSGYGGAVAAARLAGATLSEQEARASGRYRAGEKLPQASVWLLERGDEHLPGSFPARFADLPGELRFSRQDGKAARGSMAGLFDVRLGDDVNVLVGNGLGGGSLINAGVMEIPDDRVFKDKTGWPAAITADSLAAGYRLAREMLAPAKLPGATPQKLTALGALGRARQLPDDAGDGYRCELAIGFNEGQQTRAGVQLAPCTRCGDCITGCNPGAKQSLDTNYLAWARRSQAQLFCGGWVERLRPARDQSFWWVDWHYTDPARRPPGGRALQLRARSVVLAAGSLGSTEILLRSRNDKLTMSARLGEGFSTNGDQIAAVFRQPAPVLASRPESEPQSAPTTLVGPTISGMLRDNARGSRIAVQEFAVPAALRGVMGEVTTTFGVLRQMFDGLPPAHPADPPQQDPLAVTDSSLKHTLIVGMMGEDDGARGSIRLVRPDAAPLDAHGRPLAVDGQVGLSWDRKNDTLEVLFGRQMQWLEGACQGTAAVPGPGGTVLANPTWRMLPAAADALLGRPHGTATTVHPLGGCSMGDSAATGVVDDAGQVFDGKGGVHRGLAVLDGAIVPRALGINPALTIAALAERAVPMLASRWALTLRDPAVQPADGLPPLQPANPPAPTVSGPTDIRIGEQMHGEIRLGERTLWAELEVSALRLEDLATKTTQAEFTVPVERRIEGRDTRPRLRLFEQRPGDAGRAGSKPLATVVMDGQLHFMAAQRLDAQASTAALLDAVRVLLDRFRSRPPGGAAGDSGESQLLGGMAALGGLLQTLSYSRRLRYTFTVEEPGASDLKVGDALVGEKTIAFSERANPWRQLMTMSLQLQPRRGSAVELGRLETDLDYFVRLRSALLSLLAQRDHPSALADLAGFGLKMLRILMVTHWPHFVPPGDMPQHIGERGAGTIPGLPPPRRHLLQDGALLVHYPAAQPAPSSRPLLMIHGLSAAGSTFAHPQVPGNLVSFMHQRGRDVWVVELRTSAANEPPQGRPGPFSFEDIADGDIPQAVDRIVGLTGSGKVDVIAHCIGAVMFCVAALKHPTLHRSISHAVLSQAGPLAELSPFNRLRGYLASFLQQYLAVDELDVRPDYERDPGSAQPLQWRQSQVKRHAHLMLDSLLATFPYRDDDREAARAAALDTTPGESRDFRTVRHRADAIIGQSFELQNIADDTLLALDAIYGWVKTRTLAQTLFIAREGLLTNADGVNDTVFGEAIGKRFGFPVLLVHGRRNQVFDWQGTQRSYELLKSVFNEARGDNSASNGDVHLGAGSPRQMLLLQRYGHQDTMIGQHACNDVFPAIDRFLASTEHPWQPQPLLRPRYVCQAPWMGPMLGWVRDVEGDPDRLDVSLLVHPGPRNAEVICAVLVPVQPRPDGGHGRWLARPAQAFGLAVLPQHSDQKQRDLLQRQVLQLRISRASAMAGECAYAVLVLYRDVQDSGSGEDEHRVGPRSRAEPGDPPPRIELAPDELHAVQRFFGSGDGDIDDLVMTLGAAVCKAADRRHAPARAPARISFAVGSCQYPSGLFDRIPAGHSYRRLAERVEKADSAAPGFLLLLGDQAYLDALANVFEAPGEDADDIARRAYELNWRLPPLRRVVSATPVYSMLDDHEVIEAWQPGPQPSVREQVALQAFHDHQGKLNPTAGEYDEGAADADASVAAAALPSSFTFRFAPGGVPFFVLDPRSKRDWRSADGCKGTVKVADAHIVCKEDMSALLAWLDDRHTRRSPIKFIASSSIVLPPNVHHGSAVERLQFDSWSGYPASLCRLLRHIETERIAGVVLLCGDAHFSCVTRFDFDSGAPAVHSIVASGLYSPWPFANSRLQHLVLAGAVTLTDSHAGDVSGRMTERARCTEPGFTLLTVNAGAATLDIELPNGGTLQVTP